MDAAVGFPAAVSKWLGLEREALRAHTGLVLVAWETPQGRQEGTGEDGQHWVVAAAWHGKDQGAGDGTQVMVTGSMNEHR